MVKNKDKEDGIPVDQKIIKMMYNDYSSSLMWAEFLYNNYRRRMTIDTQINLENHIKYLKRRVEEFWSKI